MGYFHRILIVAFAFVTFASAHAQMNDSTVFLHLTYFAGGNHDRGGKRVVRTFAIEAQVGDHIVPGGSDCTGGIDPYAFQLVSIDSDSCVTFALGSRVDLSFDIDVARRLGSIKDDQGRTLERVCTKDVDFFRGCFPREFNDSLWTYSLRVDRSSASFLAADSSEYPRMIETTEIEKPETWIVRRESLHDDGTVKFECFKVLDSMMRWVRHGVERNFAPDGSVIGMATWKRGRVQGRAAAWNADGSQRYEGFYDTSETHYDHVKHGNWTWWDSTGAVEATGSFDHGTGRRFYPDGTLKAEEFCENGKAHGVWKGFYPNGKPSHRISFCRGERFDQSIYWYESGQVHWRETYAPGCTRSENLPEQSWHPDGEPVGKRRSAGAILVRQFWYANGQIEKERVYNRSSATTTSTIREWYDDGTPKLTRDDTVSCKWHKTGEIKQVYPIMDGKSHGKCRTGYASGRIEWEGECCEGKRTGVWRMLGEDGVLMRTIDYATDPAIETCYFPSGNLESRGPTRTGRFKRGIWECFDENGNLLFREFWRYGELQRADTLYTPETQ